MTAEEVKLSIFEAWSGTTRPERAAIPSNPSGYYLECNQVADFFAGRNWFEVGLSELLNEYRGDHSACLNFMSPAAFAYYLPTYMLLALERYEEADLAAEAAVAAFAPISIPGVEGLRARRRAALTAAQQQAVGEFLEWFTECHSDDWGLYEPSSVLAHWRHAG
jgi:hypothetical protein